MKEDRVLRRLTGTSDCGQALAFGYPELTKEEIDTVVERIGHHHIH
jgi:hypothetical protein